MHALLADEVALGIHPPSPATGGAAALAEDEREEDHVIFPWEQDGGDVLQEDNA